MEIWNCFYGLVLTSMDEKFAKVGDGVAYMMLGALSPNFLKY